MIGIDATHTHSQHVSDDAMRKRLVLVAFFAPVRAKNTKFHKAGASRLDDGCAYHFTKSKHRYIALFAYRPTLASRPSHSLSRNAEHTSSYEVICTAFSFARCPPRCILAIVRHSSTPDATCHQYVASTTISYMIIYASQDKISYFSSLLICLMIIYRAELMED